MPNTKQPFIYTLKHKMLVRAASSAATIPNNGAHQADCGGNLYAAGPDVGSLVTIYRCWRLTPHCTATCDRGWPSTAGGTQKLNLCFNSSVSNQDISVTLLGESYHSVAHRQCVAGTCC